MKNIFRQFGEWATRSGQNEYNRAVVVLTVKYTLGVLVILIVFNFLVYGLFSNAIEAERGESIEHEQALEEDHESGPNLGRDLTENLEDSLVRTLVISDGLILVLAFFTAYALSKRTMAPLEENYRNQTRFVTDAAHEFRTPLAVMQAGAEVTLRSKRTVPEYEKFINDSLSEVKRMTTLSNDLLFLAKHNKQRVHSTSSVSLSDICQTQVNALKAYAGSKSIVLKFRSDDGCTVLGNRDDLTRLVINLLKNAIDYNRPDGEVAVSLNKTRNQVILAIEDTGLGISQENLPHIFERFYKADVSRTQAHSGTGLGLAIVKEIAAEHDGAVKVSSILGKGSVFRVILPAG